MALKSESFKVRATQREVEALKQLAELHGMSASEFLRDLLRKAARQRGLLPELHTEQSNSKKLSIAA